LTARVSDVKLIGEYRNHVDTPLDLKSRSTSSPKFDAQVNWTWTTEEKLLI
jgi:hypothetical protein